MINWKDCIVPIGGRAEQKAFPLQKKKRIEVRCSTCKYQSCHERFSVVEWRHCWKWSPELEVTKNEG